MSEPRQFSLEAVRTDGWFERIGETIGSFQALCDIIGAQFFAFAMITGARITALTVDRRVPDNTMVDFTVGEEGDPTAEVQSVTLGEFRQRLVAALVQEEPIPPAPTRDTDVEGLQQHLGVRYLLLAPLFGYGLTTLRVDEDGSRVDLLHDGVEENYQLSAFRARLRTHVRQEHERVSRSQNDGSIDLGRVSEAEDAAASANWGRVIQLLGAWPAPLAIFLRTPEGQALGTEARETVARGLALLGTACVEHQDFDKAEEILRLAVQYTGDGAPAADVYLRLGLALLAHARPGEAIGPLRRAVALQDSILDVWPALGRAFLERNRNLAAFSAALAGLERGVPHEQVWPIQKEAAERLGPAYKAWTKFLGENDVTELSGPVSSKNAAEIDESTDTSPPPSTEKYPDSADSSH